MIEVNKIAIPFAKSGNKSTIYDYKQQGQAENEATWSTGFPPITMIRKEDGGLPPTGLDFNGIFYDISSNVVFSCMGGQYKFDKDYAEKIGGYPKGAILLNNKENKQYISNIDNNKVDFNSVDPVKLTQWSVVTIADIDKLLNEKVTNADFSQALNQKANTSTNINAGNGLTGGGNLTTSRTIELGTPTAITQSSTNSVTATSHTHSISKATIAQQGIVQLSSALTDREDLAATPKSVNNVNRAANNAQTSANIANDKANAARTRADDAYSLANSKWSPQKTIGDGNLMREGAYGLGTDRSLLPPATQMRDDVPSGIYQSNEVGWTGGYAWGATLALTRSEKTTFAYFPVEGVDPLFIGNKGSDKFAKVYADTNTTVDRSGFLRASGSVNALTTSDVTQSLGTSTTLVASQALVNSVNSKIKTNTASKSLNGWWKCGDTGLIYQWGTVDYDSLPPESDVSVNFPISFTSDCLNVSLTRKVLVNSSTRSNDGGVLLASSSKSNFVANLAYFSGDYYSVRGFTWFAIGY